MLGKRYAMELVGDIIAKTESILHRAVLYYEDTPAGWQDIVDTQIRNTLAILDDDYEIGDASYNGRDLVGFLLIKRGFGERGAQILYEKIGYETTMRFGTIIDGKHKSVVVTLEDDETQGYLDYFDSSDDLRITTLKCIL